MKKNNQADPFDVWGWPPDFLLKELSSEQVHILRRYVSVISDKAYRTAYDNGFIEGLTKIGLLATVEMKKQRDRMLKESRSR